MRLLAFGRYARVGPAQAALLRGPLAGLGAILGSTSSLSATALITSALGFLFWSLAAREAPPAAVGLAAAAVSASVLLATMSMFGFGTLLIGEIAAGRDCDHSLLTTSLLVVAACGTAVGVAFGALGPGLVPELRPFSGGFLFSAVFAVAVGTTAVGQLFDQVVVALLRAELQLGRNTLYSLTKLAALAAASPMLINDPGIIIFAVWPLGNLLSIVGVAIFMVWRPVGMGLGRPRLGLLRHVGAAALNHHVLNLALQAPALVLPVLVAVSLSTTANAYFYTAWMVATVAFLPQTALATTLYALGAREPAVLTARARLTVGLALLESVVAIAAVQILANWVLAWFGARYAAEASTSLRILILALAPSVIKTHFVALSRVRRRLRAAGAAVVLGSGVEIAAAAIGARLGGLPGLSIGWVVGLSLEAACMLPSVLRTVWPGAHLWPRRARVERSWPG
jgi:O-antigen/teichoic acid export membrane protein